MSRSALEIICRQTFIFSHLQYNQNYPIILEVQKSRQAEDNAVLSCSASLSPPAVVSISPSGQ
jgi:hypothetical protein